MADRKYNNKTAFYQAKKYVAKIFAELHVVPEFTPLQHKTIESKPFEPKRAAEIYVDGEYIGVIGEFKNSVKNEFKLADYLAGFEIDLDLLLSKQNPSPKINLTKKEQRDLTVATDKTYGEVVEKITKTIKSHDLEAEILPISIYQADNSDQKSISVHLEFTKFDEKIMPILEDLQF